MPEGMCDKCMNYYAHCKCGTSSPITKGENFFDELAHEMSKPTAKTSIELIFSIGGKKLFLSEVFHVPRVGEVVRHWSTGNKYYRVESVVRFYTPDSSTDFVEIILKPTQEPQNGT